MAQVRAAFTWAKICDILIDAALIYFWYYVMIVVRSVLE